MSSGYERYLNKVIVIIIIIIIIINKSDLLEQTRAVALATQANHRNTSIKDSAAGQLAFDSVPAHYDMQSLLAGHRCKE